MMSDKNSPYKVFEIKIGDEENSEVKRVSRITFQEAVRDAYLLVAGSKFSKSIFYVRLLE